MFNLRAFLNLDYYTSELDQFLKKFNHEHPAPSKSQKREMKKYNRIHRLRDSAEEATSSETSFWDKF